MPRMARQKSSTKVYHVILRGNAKQDIFLDKQDYYKFYKEICNTKEKYQYKLYVYCFMTNHVHLVIYDEYDKLSKILQSLSISYSNYFNKKYERVGHLFQNRFLSKNVETKEYLMQLCRYIHQNPYKAGISRINNYDWSSYKEYIAKPEIVDTQQIMQIFGGNTKEAKRNFIEFHNIVVENKYAEDLLEYEIREKLTDNEVKRYIKNILEIESFSDLKKLEIKQRNNKLKELKKIKGASIIQIARIIGVSAKMIERAVK